MKLALYRSYSFLAVALLALLSCKKEYESIEVLDDQQIQAYIKQNNITGVQQYKDTGMYYQVITPGSGPVMEYSDQVPLVFTFKTLDGAYTASDTVGNHYANYLGYFSLEGVRTGVKEILKNSGGQIRLLIPSRSAYGRNGSGKIPGNACLDVTVKAINPVKLPDYEDAAIKKYMQDNGFSGFTKNAKGVYYKITSPGTGSPITLDSTLTIETTGKLLNGTVFQQPTAFSAQLNDLIAGWKQTIPLIKEGGTIQLFIPSAQGYGLQEKRDDYTALVIPAFSSLYFDVKVTAVSP